MKTPHPEDYVDYLNLPSNTGHQLEDDASFNRTVVKAKGTSHRDKSDDRHTSSRKQRKEKKGSGSQNSKPITQVPRSFRPPESEQAKALNDIAQTLIDRRKRLNQCSRCGDSNHFWRKSPAATPVVTSAKLYRKRTINAAGH